MQTTQKHFLIIAGEASGDIHGAHLVNEMKKADPDCIFSGLGGQKMKASGVNLFADLTKYAVVGFVEVLKHYSIFRSIFDDFIDKCTEIQPTAVILIDYPGFNLRMAKACKKLNIPVYYYISPQVWAWKENRVKQIKQYVDAMLVIFPFEVDFYAKHNINAHYVGHPLIEEINISQGKEQFLKNNKLNSETFTLGLLPGSREKEIERNLPVMIEAAKTLSNDFNHIQVLIPKADTIDEQLIEKHIGTDDLNVSIIKNNTTNAINACDFCFVASGTATLQTALLLKPMIVVYKTSLLTWLLAKLFVKIPHIGMVNVVAGKRIVPECVQFHATAKNIAFETKNIITNEIKVAEIIDELKKVKDSLSQGKASETAAKLILSLN